MIESFYISSRFFSNREIKSFFEKFGYNITEISYSSSAGEIDFSNQDEKQFLFEKGYPKILSRFFI